MSGDNSRNKEFEEQLRLQQLYGQKPGEGTDPYTFTDPEDGTVYDWDHDKKAWFPKVCMLVCLSGFANCISICLSVFFPATLLLPCC